MARKASSPRPGRAGTSAAAAARGSRRAASRCPRRPGCGGSRSPRRVQERPEPDEIADHLAREPGGLPGRAAVRGAVDAACVGRGEHTGSTEKNDDSAIARTGRAAGPRRALRSARLRPWSPAPRGAGDDERGPRPLQAVDGRRWKRRGLEGPAAVARAQEPHVRPHEHGGVGGGQRDRRSALIPGASAAAPSLAEVVRHVDPVAPDPDLRREAGRAPARRPRPRSSRPTCGPRRAASWAAQSVERQRPSAVPANRVRLVTTAPAAARSRAPRPGAPSQRAPRRWRLIGRSTAAGAGRPAPAPRGSPACPRRRS